MARDDNMTPAWSGNGMVSTLNGTGFMFEVRDAYADEFIEFAGQTDGEVLEVGCAYGVATIPALEAGARIVACDMEERHLTLLRKKLPAELLPRLATHQGRLPEVDFEPERFAGILSSRVLHFMQGDDIDTAVGKMFTWLQPGGRLYLVVDTPYGIWRRFIPSFEENRGKGMRWPGMMYELHKWVASGPRKRASPDAPPFMNLFDLELLERTCLEAGFEIQRSGYIDRSDFQGLGRMDGRENAGIFAIRPNE